MGCWGRICLWSRWQLRVGIESEGKGEGCPSAVPLTLLGWTPTWPLHLPFSLSSKHPSKQELYFKGRNKEMKDVDFEWKANGWFFHLKWILSLSNVLIVNWWKLLLSVVNGKRNERGKKRSNNVFPFCVFLGSWFWVALNTIARSRCLFALNVYSYFRCQITKCFVYVCNAIHSTCFMLETWNDCTIL